MGGVGIDIEATRAAAGDLRDSAASLESVAADVQTAEGTSVLDGSSSAPLLVGLQVSSRQRLAEARTEFATLADGMDLLADNTASATGEG